MLPGAPKVSECPAGINPWALTISLTLCVGMVISYLPQHTRIIRAGSSEGFSPWYLLLGATSSASGMLNILVVQWKLFRCCQVISAGRCFESLLGFIQVTLQWLLFTIILVLYLYYFPPHLKYQRTLPLRPDTGYGAITAQHDLPSSQRVPEGDMASAAKPAKPRLSTTPEWRLAVTLGWVVFIHLVLLTALSLVLLYTLPPTQPPHPLLSDLATFFGLSATILAVLQYAPQIYKTYRSGLVGALSLGTMVIQVPGSVLFVFSLVIREGTDWTSWLTYAVTGVMQGALLVICLCWKQRQKRLGVDDFGNPLPDRASPETEADTLLRD